MGKKRDKANENIAILVHEMIGYMQGYVTDCNCPYKFNLLGAKGLNKPNKCKDCETCKRNFWLNLEATLLNTYIVQ